MRLKGETTPFLTFLTQLVCELILDRFACAQPVGFVGELKSNDGPELRVFIPFSPFMTTIPSAAKKGKSCALGRFSLVPSYCPRAAMPEWRPCLPSRHKPLCNEAPRRHPPNRAVTGRSTVSIKPAPGSIRSRTSCPSRTSLN